MTDVTQYKPGDTVSLSGPNGSQLNGLTVEKSPGHPDFAKIGVRPIERPSDSFWVLEALPSGWSVTKHEPAAELPTEPGVYMSLHETALAPWDVTTQRPGADTRAPYVLVDDERGWFCNGVHLEPTEVARFAPFTLLRPVDEVRRETAAEVIDWMMGRQPLTQGWVQLERGAREHFGLVSE